MHAPAMIDAEFAERMLWPRILAEAEQPAGSEHVLTPLIADCVTSNLTESRLASQYLAKPVEPLATCWVAQRL